MSPSTHTMETWQTLFSCVPKLLQVVTVAIKLKDMLLRRNAMTNPDCILKKQRHHFADKGLYSQSFVFPVVMYGCESWTIKKAEPWRIDAFNCGSGEDSWESFAQQGDQTSQSLRKSTLNIHWKDWYWSWSSNTLTTWLTNRLNGKDPDAGKDWRQEEKGTTEDEMVGWHHQLDGHEFEQAPGVDDGQGSLACCSPWGLKESDTTWRLNNNTSD